MKVLVIVLFILFSYSLYGQEHKDRIIDATKYALSNSNDVINTVNVLDSLSYTYAAINPQEGIKYGQQMLLLSEQLGFEQGVATASSNIGVNYAELSDFPNALSYDFKALKLCTNAGNKKGMACNLVNIGLVYLAQTDFARALNYFYKGLRIYEELSDQKNIAATLNNVGNVYLVQKNYPKAAQNYQQALKIYQTLHFIDGTAICLGNLGVVCKEQGNYRKALDYHLEALAALKQSNNKYALQTNLADIGIIYRHLNNYTEALAYQSMALSMSEELGNQQNIALNLGNIGETYLAIGTGNADTFHSNGLIKRGKQNNLRSAVDFLQRAIAVCKTTSYNSALIEFNSCLADAYYQLGKYQLAFDVLKDKELLSDSLFSPKKMGEMTRVEVKRALELKDKQLIIDQQNVELRKHNVLIYIFFAITLVLILIIATNYLYAFRKSNLHLEKENRETLSLLLEAQFLAKVGSWNVDVAKNEIYWSEGTRITYGVDKDFKPSFEAFISMIHPEDRDRIVAGIMDGQKTGKTVKYIFRIVRPDGGIRVLNGITKFELGKDGKPTRVYGISHDITELNLAEETLRKSEANIKTIFDNTDTAYILVDAQLNIISFNKPAQEFAQEMLQLALSGGNPILFYFPEEDRVAVSQQFDRVLGAESISFESKYTSHNATEKWYEFHYIPVLFFDNNVSAIIMSVMDITKRKRSEQLTKELVDNLQKKNNDLNQFAYIISHNLRAPIVKVLGLAGLFNKEDAFDDNKKIVGYIAEEVSRLDKIIKDLNDIIAIRDVRYDAKELVVFQDNVNLITDVLKQQIKAANVTISTHFEVTDIATAKAYLYSIMYNLMSNAIKYRSPNRPLHIDVATKEEDGMIRLSVADNGMGIDLNKYGDELFGLYKRFNSKNIEGNGLGLYLVKTQVASLGGYIRLNSEIDKGTTFYIYLPKNQ